MDKGTALGTVALVISACVGMQALMRDAPQRPAPPDGRLLDRVAALEARLDLLTPEGVAPLRSGVAPASDSLDERLQAVEDHLLVLQAKADAGLSASAPRDAADRPGAPDTSSASSGASGSPEVRDEVQRAVDAKVAELVEETRIKANKKPSFAVFADALELDPTQRHAVEHEVREGQRTMRTLLETPVAGGQTVLDELVEVMAYGQAMHPEASQRWMAWWQRITTETVPGTDRTYAQHAEAIKQDVNTALERELNAEQFAEYEAWGLDPTDIEEVADTPWADLEGRIGELAEALRQTK